MSTHKCPDCEREFESRRGLGVHYKRIHGTHLPNRECHECGEKFYAEHANKYCSDKCRQQNYPLTGKDAPNYQGAREVTECVLCGSEFEFYPSDKKGLYCSDCVKEEDWYPKPELTGENNPQWKGGKVTKECVVCGSPVTRFPSMFKSDVVVCSEPCRREWLSDAFDGEGHPNWKGGGNEAYGKGWYRVRQDALERDQYRCVVCGVTKEELGKNPDVHHIVPVREFIESPDREMTDAHTLDNVVSLCIACHRKADFGKISTGELREAIGCDGQIRP